MSSGLALAILSGVVLLARVALLPLRHFPRSVGVLYDVLLAVLWSLGLAQLVSARATARNLSHGDGGGGIVGNTDGVVVTCWRLRGVAVASAAVVFYSGRLLWELCVLFTGNKSTSAEYRPIQQRDEWEADREKGGVVVHAPQAYSPVLAFFPDD